jgi:hypothetical protein
VNAVFLFPSNMLIRKGRYHYRRRVPVDLVDLFNRKEITKTLRSTRALDATRLKNRLDAQIEELFQACRFHVLHPEIAKAHLKIILSGKPSPPYPANTQPTQLTSAPTASKLKTEASKAKRKTVKHLSDAIDAYCKEYEHGWAPRTRREFPGMFKRITDMLSNPPLKNIIRPLLVTFRDALAETMQVKTVNKYVQLLSTVLNYASSLQWISGNPAKRLSLKDTRRVDEIRPPFSPEQINIIFEALQKDKKSFYEIGHHELYLLPLL